MFPVSCFPINHVMKVIKTSETDLVSSDEATHIINK